VNVEVPEAGIMETDWAENRAKIPQDAIRSTLGKVFDSLYSTAERDKFRTRLEKGAEPGTVEIYISHRGMYEIYTNEGRSDTKWQPRPADPELEAEMLRRLMVRLGVEESRAKTWSRPNSGRIAPSLSRATDGAGALVAGRSLRSRLAPCRPGAGSRRVSPSRIVIAFAGPVFRALCRSR
jgi:outer membrane protein assembly factor BamC